MVTLAGSAGRLCRGSQPCHTRNRSAPCTDAKDSPEFPEHGRGRVSLARAGQRWGPSAGSLSWWRWPRCQPRQLRWTSGLGKQLREPAMPWGVRAVVCSFQLFMQREPSDCATPLPKPRARWPPAQRGAAQAVYSCRMNRGLSRHRPARRSGRSFLTRLEMGPQPRLSPGWQQRAQSARTEGTVCGCGTQAAVICSAAVSD